MRSAEGGFSILARWLRHPSAFKLGRRLAMAEARPDPWRAAVPSFPKYQI
jgi:hypothetical protein